MDGTGPNDAGVLAVAPGDEALGIEPLDEAPEVVEIRMDYAKDVVQLGKGGGCSWK